MLSIRQVYSNLYELVYLNNYVYFCINICSKSRETIEEEIKRIGLNTDKIQAIIPENLVKTPLQFVQAIIHYILYGNELGVKNKGLLLSMLVIGEDQISNAVETLSKNYRESNRYYLFSINNNCREILSENCEPFVLNNIRHVWMYYKPIVKNLSSILKRL